MSETSERPANALQFRESGSPSELKDSLIERTATDPREYFRNTAFQKVAEQIDPDKTHPWQAAQGDGFLVTDEYGQVAMATTFDEEEADEDNKIGLLLSETAIDGQGSSIYIRNELAPRTRGHLVDIVNQVSPRLSGEKRHTFIRTLIGVAPFLENQSEEAVAETLAVLTLKLLPDHPQAAEAAEIPQIGTANAQQQEQLTQLMQLASKKMPSAIFLQKLNKLQDDLRWIDDPFGRNYASMLTEIKNWVLDSRQDTTRNYNILQKGGVANYSIEDKATRDFRSPEELEQILKTLPVEPMPDVRLASRNREQAMLVPLDQVLGGTGIKDWTVSTSQDRGLGKIFELSRALREGSASIEGGNYPIKAVEVDGKFFIESDGRHRTAALKALGVKEVPMLVTRVQK